MVFAKSFSKLVLLAALCAPSLGGIVQSTAQLPAKQWDYVIVGAGTAGNVLARRLSDDPKTNVLVVEAGGSNEAIGPDEAPPFLAIFSIGSDPKYNWNSKTTPMPGFGNRSIPYSRGKTLGGSSAISDGFYNYGSQDDWNYYADLIGDKSWSWDQMTQYFNLIEKPTPPADGRNTTDEIQWNKGANSNGALPLALVGYKTQLETNFLETIKQLPQFGPFNLNVNSGDPRGMSWIPSAQNVGKRATSAESYLTNDVRSRPNLFVVLNTQAEKLVQNGTKDGKPSFHDVVIKTYNTSSSITVHANKEIILSAGPFGSPTLLQLSGIGDPNQLMAAGVKPIVNLPSVGKNISDHVVMLYRFIVNSNNTFDFALRDQAAAIAEWKKTYTGPMTGNLAAMYGWYRMQPNNTFFQQYPDPAPGKYSVHYEILASNCYVGHPPANGSYMTFVNNLFAPTSRGYVTINSANPYDQPTIDMNLLGEPQDTAILVQALKQTWIFKAAPAWKDYIIATDPSFASIHNDEQLEGYIRQTADTDKHATGSCSLSPKDAKWGVLDPQLRVKGAEGIRVVDSSVLPRVPQGHTLASTYLLAEHGAKIITGKAAL